MSERQEFIELEIDFFPDKESSETVAKFLQGLKDIAEAQNRSSDGAGFTWKVKIEAEGEWV